MNTPARAVAVIGLVVVSGIATSPISGCAGGGMGGGQLVQSMMPLISQLAGNWNVQSLAGSPVASMLPQGAQVPSLSFMQDGSVGGFTGVNRLSSSVDVAGLANGDFKLAPAAMTKMAGPPEQMKVENMFTDLLGKVKSAKMTDGGKGLSLTDGASELIRLVKAG